MKCAMKGRTQLLGLTCTMLVLLSLGACSRELLSGSKLTSANYDQITLGMSKTQVENILGKPTSIGTKAEKTTFRYENGKKLVTVTFKNGEVENKDTNLGREP